MALIEFGATYDIFPVGRNAAAALDGGLSMVLYEVNLVVEAALTASYRPWLDEHIQEMLQFQGFEDAKLWVEQVDEQDDALRYTVHYVITAMDDLERYFAEHAERMRSDGMERFPVGVSAHRRVFTGH